MNQWKKIVLATLALMLISFALGCGDTRPAAIVPPPANLSAPASLTATPGNGQVVLSWTTVSGASSYNLYYGTSSPLTIAGATKVGSLAATSYTLTGLTNATLYYFAVTAANSAHESSLSNEASARPTNGNTLAVTPGTATSGTLAYSTETSLTFNFPANVVNQAVTVTITPVPQSGLPVPMSVHRVRKGMARPMTSSNDTFVAAFQIDVDPTQPFNVPVAVGGTQTISDVVPAGATLNLALLQNNAWVDISTLVVGTTGGLNQTLPSVNLPGLMMPGIHLLYKPHETTTISNLGIALLTDDGREMGDGQNGLQVIHFYDASGALLNPPTITYLDYPSQSDLDGAALTPDGSQGVIIDGSNTIGFFSGVQTGTPVASTYSLDVSAYGYDGDSVAVMPNGDEAVISLDSSNNVLLISGILSGSAVAAELIPMPNYRDGVVISNDGLVLLARGSSGVTAMSIASIPPIPGSLGGTKSHSFTSVAEFADLGRGYGDGRNGMAISPTDSSRAVVVSFNGSTINLLTNLTSTPTEGTTVAMPSGTYPLSVAISPNGKMAIVGSESGLLMYSGVDTGTLAQVGTTAYAPTYTLSGSQVTLGIVYTLGITLDGKYVVAGDADNGAVVVIPFNASGFGAPASALGDVAIPYNDQLLIH